MDSDDFNIAMQLNEPTTKFKLFTSQCVNRRTGGDSNEDNVLSYDNVFLKYQEKNHQFACQMNFHQFEFVGRILASSSFTAKNKTNLLKYIATLSANVIAMKDSALKFVKLQPFLIFPIFVARKLREAQSKGTVEPVEHIEQESFGYLKQIAENSFTAEDHIIKLLSSVAYSLLFTIKTTVPNTTESLLK